MRAFPNNDSISKIAKGFSALRIGANEISGDGIVGSSIGRQIDPIYVIDEHIPLASRANPHAAVPANKIVR